MKTYLYLVMAEIQVIEHQEGADQPQMIIIMVRWSLALVTVFFKGFLSMTRYCICQETWYLFIITP
jgi:hypothetical protein